MGNMYWYLIDLLNPLLGLQLPVQFSFLGKFITLCIF